MKRKGYRLLSTLLVLCMALPLLPGTVLATEDSGTCVENVTWSYSDGVLSIQGSGDMLDYAPGDSMPWYDYRGDIKTAIIENGVTSIGDCAFLMCNNLTSVTIPDSVTSIGAQAFSFCTSLINITIPNSVTTIGNSAFLCCENLTGVTIPDSATIIGEETFVNCTGLTSITIPSSLTRVESDAFLGCESLKDVYYGGSESQWKQIYIEQSGQKGMNTNAPLLNATIHYNSAAPSTSPTPAPSAGISVTVGGRTVTWIDAEPFIDANDRTMVPLRAVADAMSLDVNWDAAAREATFTNGSKTIYFPIDSTTARTGDGRTIQMDTAAVIANDRTYAPIRYLAEFFGYTVDWDAATKTVILN